MTIPLRILDQLNHPGGQILDQIYCCLPSMKHIHKITAHQTLSLHIANNHCTSHSISAHRTLLLYIAHCHSTSKKKHCTWLSITPYHTVSLHITITSCTLYIIIARRKKLLNIEYYHFISQTITALCTILLHLTH